MLETKFWRDALGFLASEIEVIKAEMLANEDCDAVVSARREGNMELDSEFRLLGFEDVVVKARNRLV